MLENLFKLPTGEEYVSEKSLSNLKLYKYSAVDKSYLTKYVLRHYWSWAVTLFPLWMAPNLITLLGLGFQVISIILILIYDPELTGPAPGWVYIYYGIGMWLYSTFDNVDGKQARRTNSSSPLGELFDHGCDALNCLFGALVQSAAFGLGISNATLVFSFMTTLNFYLSTWEEYHTGTLYLGYINGPTEILVLACLGSFMSGIYGPHIWHFKANEFIPFSEVFFSPNSTLVDAMTGVTVLFAIFFVGFASFSHVYKALKAKNKPFLPSLFQLIPFIVPAFSVHIWTKSSGIIMQENHLVLLLLTAGFAFGRMTTKIILAHLTKSEFPYFTVQIVPLALGALLSTMDVFSKSAELIYLWCSFIFVMSAYFHWAVTVINTFTKYLNINCLTIPYDHKKS